MKWLFKVIVIMLLLGATLVAVGFFMGIDMEGFQSYLSDHEAYGEQKEYRTTTEITEIQFDLDTRDINLYLSDEAYIRIEYYEKDTDTWSISENEGIFYVSQDEKPQIWFNFRLPNRTYRQVGVYLPKDLYLNLHLQTKTGTIKGDLSDVQSYEDVFIKSNTGSIQFSNISAKSFIAQTDTGTVTVEDIHVLQAMSLESKTGSVVAKVVSAQQLTLKTSTGSARLENSQIENQAKITVSTGSITVSNTIASSFDLNSSTGDINFTVVSDVTYRYDLSVSTGTIRVFGADQGKAHSTNIGDIILYAKTGTGSIRIQS